MEKQIKKNIVDPKKNQDHGNNNSILRFSENHTL